MTNHWIDIKNSDVIMIIGSNAAENHPISFKWVQRAIDKGAKLCVVDPRYTRTAAKASFLGGTQLYVKIRSGTDIAFMLGMMRYAVANGRVNWQYVRDCTNAPYLLSSGFQTCPDTGGGKASGIFSGLVPETSLDCKEYKYDTSTWAYQFAGPDQPAVDSAYWGAPNSGDIASGPPGTSPNANSVWAKFLEQISPYTVTMVSNITGADPAAINAVYDAYTSTYVDDQSACIMHAMGSTQHTYGSQNVRSYAMMQLLLGNVGVAGGGINALRGESNAQGSTDMCLLWHILPGYLAVTDNSPGKGTRAAYKDGYSSGKAPWDISSSGTAPASLSWWKFGGKYIDSLLQAWWPKEYSGNPDQAYHYLPKADKNRCYTHETIFEDMTAWMADPANDVPAKPQYIFGLMCWGQNPAVSGPSCDFERKTMENLDWMVCVDLWETETAAFWKRPGVDPTTINTEVYLLPAAASYEKEGSVVNSGRWSQWRYKTLNPPGLAMDDLSIINELGKRLIALYLADGSVHANIRYPVALLWWGPYCDPAAHYTSPHKDAHGGDGSNYDDGNVDPRTGLLEANPHKVGWEINGYFCPSSTTGTQGTRVDGFWRPNSAISTLQEDGQTSSGNWLYCSHYVNPGDPFTCFDTTGTTLNGNRQENRDPNDNSVSGIGLYSRWAICWPLNQRIIYNGASVFQTGHPNVGQPLAPNKWVVAWDSGGTAYRTPGNDVTDGFTPPGGGSGARYPFIMQREGQAHLFGPGMEDGPFPWHYEPWETREEIVGPHLSDVYISPTLFAHSRPRAYEHPSYSDPNPPYEEFPIVGTTYRVAEHWQAGAMTRNLPWMCELQPDAFVEMSEELAALLGIVNGDTVEMKSQRTELYGTRMLAKACVTKRLEPFTIFDQEVHLVGVIWHFGYMGCCTGRSANLLTTHIGDANSATPEYKAYLCNIRKYPDGSWLS